METIGNFYGQSVFTRTESFINLNNLIFRYADRNVDVSREFKKSQEKNIFKNNVVSFTLVGIVCLFFLALSFLYMGMRTDHVPLLDIESKYLLYLTSCFIQQWLFKTK